MPFTHSCLISYRHTQFKKGQTYLRNLMSGLKEELEFHLDQGVWLDDDRLNTGQYLEPNLAKGLMSSVCMIVVYTPNYFSLEHTFCAREYHSMLLLERARLGLLPDESERSNGLILPLALRDHDLMLRQIQAADTAFQPAPAAAGQSWQRLGKNLEPYTSERGIRPGGAYEKDIRSIAQYIRGRWQVFQSARLLHAIDAAASPNPFVLSSVADVQPWLVQVVTGARPVLPSQEGA